MREPALDPRANGGLRMLQVATSRSHYRITMVAPYEHVVCEVRNVQTGRRGPIYRPSPRLSGGADGFASACSTGVAAIFRRCADPHGGFGVKPVRLMQRFSESRFL